MDASANGSRTTSGDVSAGGYRPASRDATADERRTVAHEGDSGHESDSGHGDDSTRGDDSARGDDSDPPLVSVVVPTYGRPEFLAEALRSVGEQTYGPIELIVVDDHSPAPAAPVVEGLDLDVRSVRCLRHEENRGANAARNTGIEAASGRYLAFLDDDDRWRPETVERAVGTLRESPPEVGLVTVGMRIVDAEGRQIGLTLPDVDADRDPIEALVAGSSVGSFSRITVRREVVEAAGPTDERFPCWQDWEWEFRLARHCRFASVREPLVIRRVSEKEQITDDFEGRKDVAYPLLRERHRSTVAARGRATLRRFESQLALVLGASALPKGRYLTAVRYLLRALRYDPTNPETYLYLALAAGGPIAYGPAVRLKRRFGSHVPNP